MLNLSGAVLTLVRRGAPSALLVETAAFGPNPGGLKMFSYRPANLVAPAPLVVLLHGCTQSARGFAQGAGWIALADRYGFALLCPQQRAANNLNRCFNWFQPEDAARGRGEAASIRAMVAHSLGDPALDQARVFVTGFSAGGAMTSALLASYPDVFAGGAIIAGLPHGAASSLREGFATMMQGARATGPEWGDRVRAASPHQGPWPKVSIWQGEADTTVNPRNAEEIAKQWLDVQALTAAKPRVATIGDHQRYVWSNAGGEPMIEVNRIKDLAHGVPVAAVGDEDNNATGPFMIDAGLSSSFEIARFWGLIKTAGGQDFVAPSPTRPTLGARRGIGATLIKAARALIRW